MRDAGFIIFDVEDEWHASRCSNPEDVRLCLSNMFENRPHPTIISYEVDGYARDVTDEFRPAPVEETPTREIGWRRSHTEYMSLIGAFDR